MSIFDLYNRLGIKLTSSSFKPSIKNGKLNKGFIYTSNWKEDGRRFDKNDSAFAMLTGAISGVTAIDIDNPDLPHNAELLELCYLYSNMIAKTNKGYHALFKYCPDLKQTQGDDTEMLDIRNDGGMLYCEPSKYAHPESGAIIKYVWEVLPDDDSDLNEVPENIIQFFKGLNHSKYLKDAEKKGDASEIKSVVSVVSVGSEASDLFATLLNSISKSRFATYSSWVLIALICYNEKVDVEVLIDASRGTKLWIGEDSANWIRQQWARFKTGREKQIKQGTLWKWLKEDNPAKFIELQGAREDAWTLLKNPSHYEAAAFFYSQNPFCYINKIDYGWFVLGENNIWSYTARRPAKMLTDISLFFKILLDDIKMGVSFGSEDPIQKQRATDFNAFRKRCGDVNFLKGVATCLECFYIDEDILTKMDENRHLFAFSDKVFNLDTNEVRPIEAGDFISITCGYPFPTINRPDVRRKIYEFLFSIWENNEVVEFEINKLAYALHGNKKFEKFCIETGKGRNGKGTKSNLVKRVFGGYYHPLPISVLTKPNDKKDAPNPALVECRGKRFLEAQEPEATDRLQVGFIKEMTGNDILTARPLYGKPISFVSQGLLNIQTNAVPSYNRLDNAIMMRNIIVPYPFVFTDDVKESYERLGNCNLKKEVSSDEWRDEFMLLLLENYHANVKDAKTWLLPDIIKKRTEINAEENIRIKGWLEENYQKGNGTIRCGELFNRWRADNVDSKVSEKDFSREMELLGYEKTRDNKGRAYINIVALSEGL